MTNVYPKSFTKEGKSHDSQSKDFILKAVPDYQPPLQNPYVIQQNPQFPNQFPQNNELNCQCQNINPQLPYQIPQAINPCEIADPSLFISVNPQIAEQNLNTYQNACQFPQHAYTPAQPYFQPQNPVFIPPQNSPFVLPQNPPFIPLQNSPKKVPPPSANPPSQSKPEHKSKNPPKHFHHRLSDEELEMKAISDENREIVKSKKYQITKSETITESDHSAILLHIRQRNISNQKNKIIINKLSTINNAIKMHSQYKGKQICILSFSDPFKPGGGYLNGRSSQEETICRQTLLYPTLCESSMYSINKQNSNAILDLDTMIYSPNVYVIRDDNYKLLNKKSFMINVISSPAVDNRNNIQNAAAIMERRIRKIILLAADKGNDIIILGAFGCGILKNDPIIISQIFKNILVNEGLSNYFKSIVFPIYKSEKNFSVFNSTLSNT